MKKYLPFVGLSFILISTITACVGSGNNEQQTSEQSNKSIAAATNVTTRSWSFSYTATGQLTSATNPLGGKISYTYDASDNLTKITDELGHISQLNSYNAQGNPQSIVDPNGVTTTLTYTIDGYVSSSTTAGYKTSFTYDAAGDLTKVTNPDGSFISYTYDDAKRIVAIGNSGGNITFTLDAAGNRLSQKINDPIGGVAFAETKSYDALSRILKIVGANGAQSFTYDTENNLLSSQDGRSNATNYAWDALSRVTKVTDAKGGITQYGYGSGEQPTSIRDAKGSLTSYAYNGLDNLTTQTSPDSGNSQFTTYDAAGNLTTQIDAKGQTISYTYDLLSRPVSISYSSDVNQNVSLAYDQPSSSYGVGKLSKISNATSSTSYNYDNHGDMINETQTILGKNYLLKYTYTQAGKLASIIYPNGVIISYGYGGDGTVSQVSGAAVLATVKHLPFGPIKSITYANKLQQDITYNSSYLVTQIKLGTLLNKSYTYYPNDDIQNISGESGFEYNQLRQLTAAKGTTKTAQYSYDAVGNRSRAVISGATTNYALVSTSNRLLNTTGAAVNTYSYDNNGNIIQVNKLYYRYDSLNRLNKVESATKVFALYGYNPLSQRITKEVNGVKTVYIYNETGELLSEIDGTSGVTKRNYVWLDGAPFAILEGSNVYFFHNDHNGTPLLVTNSAGAVVWQASYDAFGQATITKATITQNLRFAGQYYDAETKLHYNWHRYYDPALGRYISSDPLGLAAGVNTYIYVNGNPINFTDPTGLDVNVCLYDGAGANIFGHTGFGLTTEKSTKGFYNSHGIITGPGAIRSDSDHTKRSCQTVKATQEQDNCMLKCRAEREQNLGNYNLLTRQCTSFVQDCLKQCNLPHSNDWWTILPSNFYLQLLYNNISEKNH